jgi:DNA-binding transcriptional LysR family regulator
MDRFRTMQTFVRVARGGSFTTAASQLGLSRALVSRHISDLEARLGVRLLNRSTRTLSLTEEGLAYVEFCERVLEEIESNERSVGRAGTVPIGTLNITAPKSFGSLHLADAIIAFAASEPRIRVSLTLDDFTFRPHDFVEGGQDVAIRTSEIRNSSVIAKRIGTLKSVLCAAPDYLDKHGTPKEPGELARHACLVHMNLQTDDRHWRLKGPRGVISIKAEGPFLSNSALVLRRATLAGQGIAMLPQYAIAHDLAAGALLPVLSQYKAQERPIIVLYPQASLVPKKVRLFVDFMARWFSDRPGWDQAVAPASIDGKVVSLRKRAGRRGPP